MVLDMQVQQNQFIDQNLKTLALSFLTQKNFTIEKNKKLTGNSGQEYVTSFHIQGREGSKDQLSTVIVILDYAKSIGTDVIYKYDRMSKDLSDKVNKIVLIGNDFSVPARNMAEKASIFLLSRGELVSILLSNMA